MYEKEFKHATILTTCPFKVFEGVYHWLVIETQPTGMEHAWLYLGVYTKWPAEGCS